jgi:2,4-dienoyl-CoA reductase-like NADH-dependent reductase (Old Yellow Enzyme family)
MMKQKLVVMLTDNDKTVGNAKAEFLASAHLAAEDWGFKDVGLPRHEMADLVKAMKAKGKVTYLEVVSLSEHEGLAGAEIAVDAGFDVLMGTVYYDSILEYIKGKGVKYYPFCGKVYGHPSILGGAARDVVDDARRLRDKGADGLDLLSFRYEDGDPVELLAKVVDAVDIPVISAGSVNSFDRITQVTGAGAAGFTIGSALFHENFCEGSFTKNLEIVCDWMSRN